MRWIARVFAIGRLADRRWVGALLIGVAAIAILTTDGRPVSNRSNDESVRVESERSLAIAPRRPVDRPPIGARVAQWRAVRSAIDRTEQSRCASMDVERFRTGDASESSMERIHENPHGFCWSLRPVLAEPNDLLRRVDRDHGLDSDYVPEDLVSLAEAHPEIPLRTGDERLTARAAEALSNMVQSAEQDGVELVVSSAYRDYETQRQLHAYWIDRLGRTVAEAVSAPAGHSQHQLGTTVDFAPVGRRFSDTPQAEWLEQHAWRYGFSLSYPEGYEKITGYNYEPWHYRYVGFAAAYLEREYFSSVQHEMLTFLHANSREREMVVYRLNRGGPR